MCPHKWLQFWHVQLSSMLQYWWISPIHAHAPIHSLLCLYPMGNTLRIVLYHFRWIDIIVEGPIKEWIILISEILKYFIIYFEIIIFISCAIFENYSTSWCDIIVVYETNCWKFPTQWFIVIKKSIKFKLWCICKFYLLF